MLSLTCPAFIKELSLLISDGLSRVVQIIWHIQDLSGAGLLDMPGYWEGCVCACLLSCEFPSPSLFFLLSNIPGFNVHVAIAMGTPHAWIQTIQLPPNSFHSLFAPVRERTSSKILMCCSIRCDWHFTVLQRASGAKRRWVIWFLGLLLYRAASMTKKFQSFECTYAGGWVKKGTSVLPPV